MVAFRVVEKRIVVDAIALVELMVIEEVLVVNMLAVVELMGEE